MLPQINRLKKNKDIRRVLKRGERFKEEFLILKVLPNNLDRPRFGFVVSKKFSKKATSRNKIKRKLRELTRLKLKKIKKGIDVIVMVTSEIEAEDFLEIDEAVNKLFKKSGIIQKIQ